MVFTYAQWYGVRLLIFPQEQFACLWHQIFTMSLIIIVTMKLSSKLLESKYEITISELESTLPYTTDGMQLIAAKSAEIWAGSQRRTLLVIY